MTIPAQPGYPHSSVRWLPSFLEVSTYSQTNLFCWVHQATLPHQTPAGTAVSCHSIEKQWHSQNARVALTLVPLPFRKGLLHLIVTWRAQGSCFLWAPVTQESCVSGKWLSVDICVSTKQKQLTLYWEFFTENKLPKRGSCSPRMRPFPEASSVV